MKVMISTFGVESGGITEGIKQFGCQKLILLVPQKPQSSKSAGELVKIEKIARKMKIKIKKIKIPPYSLMDNILKMKRIIKKHEGDEIILNVTGGRKTLSLAATLAGFVSNPSRIIYIREEDDQPIEIPKFTLGNMLLRPEKMEVLKCVESNTTVTEIRRKLGGKRKYHAIMKHLRELEDAGLLRSDGSKRPQKYTKTASGWLIG